MSHNGGCWIVDGKGVLQARVTWNIRPPRYTIDLVEGFILHGSWLAWSRKGAERKARRLLRRHHAVAATTRERSFTL